MRSNSEEDKAHVFYGFISDGAASFRFFLYTVP